MERQPDGTREGRKLPAVTRSGFAKSCVFYASRHGTGVPPFPRFPMACAVSRDRNSGRTKIVSDSSASALVVSVVPGYAVDAS